MDREFLARIKLGLEGKEQTAAGLTDIQDKMDKLSSTKITTTFDKSGAATGQQVQQIFRPLNEETKKGVGLFGEFGLAFKRAFIVAPVWMAAREVVKGTIDLFRDGIQYFLATEAATHNLESSLTDMAQTGSKSVEAIVSSMHALSLESGKTEASLINTFANVNRVLQDTTKSQIATKEATMLSLETGADQEKLAETLAFLYKLQGDSLKGASTDAQKFADISTLLYNVQAKTPGGIEKLNSDIKSFSATMSISDFGIENTIKLMGALESAGVTTGTTLKTGLMKILMNMDEVSKMLGLSVPETASSAEKLGMVLNKLSGAMQSQDKNTVFAVLKDIFGGGGGRGALNISALVKDIGSLNTALSGKGVNDQDRFIQQKQLESVNNEVGHQLELLGNLKKQWGETFIASLMGAKDFAGGLKSLNDNMATLTSWGKNVGNVLSFINPMSLHGAPNTEREVAAARRAEEEADLYTRLNFARQGLSTTSQLKQLEIDVFNNEQMQNATKEAFLQLLEAQLIKEKNLTKEQIKQNTAKAEAEILTKKQAAELENLLVKYEKAPQYQRRDIRREIELSQMNPEEQSYAYTANQGKDKKLLIDMFSKLDEKTQTYISAEIAREQGINLNGKLGTAANKVPYVGEGYFGNMGGLGAKNIPAYQPNIKGADNINITVEAAGTSKEELSAAVVKEINDKLLKDEDFQKLFAKKLYPFI